MRHSCAMLLGLVVLLTIIDAASTAAKIEMTPPDSGDQYNIPTTRFLRAHKYLAIDEERSVGASAVEGVLKSTVIDQQIEAVLQKAKSADDAFKKLKLNKAANGLLGSDELKAWIKYMKQFNQQNPTKKTSLVATLTAHYGDEGLAKMIESGKKNLVPSTARFAKNLETEQIQRWLALGKSPDDVFKLVKLHKAGSKFFDKPKLNIWVNYVDEFNKQNPTQKKTLIARLTKQYNDKSLTNMLIAAQKNPSMKSIATRIQSEQTRLWLKDGKTPEDLFNLLQLNKAGDALFENPLFTAWIKYADDFRFIHSDTKLATLSTLAKHYNDETLASMIVAAEKVAATKNTAERLHSEQLRFWLLGGENPDEVFYILKLFNANDKLIESPLFTVWVKYMTYYNQMNLKTKWNLIKTLTHRFGDSGLSDMLTAASKLPSTKTVATELQKSQINRWLSDGKSTKVVYKLLRVEGAAADDANSLLYKKYVEDFKEMYMYA